MQIIWLLDFTAKKKLLTYAGLKALEDELENLKVVKRREIAQKIKEAREQGDLSENAEYDAAKDEQRDIEARIEELEKILKNAEVVVEDDVDLDTINIGCTVDVYDKEFEEKKLRKAEYEAGVEAGIELGERSLLENQIRKKLKKGKPIEQIADELEEAVTTIQRIIEETKKEN